MAQNACDLKNFFLRWYGPNNAILTITGDVNSKKVLPLIAMDPTKYMKIMVAYSSEIEIERNTLINHGISEGQIVTLLGTSRDEVTSHLGEVS